MGIAPAGSDRRSLLRRAAATLAEAGVGSSDVDAELLLAHVLGVDRGGLALLGAVAEPDTRAFHQLVRRRAAREPLQHLTGVAPFRRLEIAVGPGVFVPRPETEVMTGWVVDALKSVLGAGRTPVVLELCAGSGAISRALADEVSEVEVYAVEVDESAYDWAARNLAGTGVVLARADMADALTIWPQLRGACDAVVANPPYIPLESWESVQPEVRDHDPAAALWSGEDGLDATRVVVRVAAEALRPGGWVASEHAEAQGRSAPAVFLADGRFDPVRDQPDLAGRPRFVTARRR